MERKPLNCSLCAGFWVGLFFNIFILNTGLGLSLLLALGSAFISENVNRNQQRIF